MVQKTTRQSGRGRPPAFDRGQVLQSAMVTFWAHGFEATTLSDLEAATGVDRSTLSNSFGGKKGLYESAGDAYVDLATAELFAPLLSGVAGTADIVEFLDRLTAGYRSEGPPGCYIVNDMSAIPTFPARARYLELLESGLRAALTRAAELGECEASSVESRARTLLASIIGINIIHKDAGDAVYPVLAALRNEVRKRTV